MNDLKQIYKYVQDRDKKIFSFYEALKNKDEQKLKIVDDFLDSIGLEKNDENRYAAVVRLVDLRENEMVEALKKAGKKEDEITKIKELSYEWVSKFYIKEHVRLLEFIEMNKLLNKFHRELLKGVNKIGKILSSMHLSWVATLIEGVNKELFEAFNGDEEKIFAMLEDKKLFDKGYFNNKADRCYSVLVHNSDGSWTSQAYCNIFKKEISEVIKKLDTLINKLLRLEDDLYHQKDEIINYLNALKDAFSESNVHQLIHKWADVDRAWMKITTPLQIGHPLEYYEDRYRKAVALEWDVRITNPLALTNKRAKIIKKAYLRLFDEISTEYQNIKKRTIDNLDRVQLYIGAPMLFYGSEFCGLFSAQVVPNDEMVTKEFGKKIFAFNDRILQSIRNRPKMKIDYEVFPENFLNQHEELISQEDLWQRIYDITTIGHEYAHTLWLDDDTEVMMNSSGEFKNIEEFKATAGALVAFFLEEDNSDDFYRYILIEHIKRSIKLISWMEVDEVQPYYCEGLIHLHGLFYSKILDFKDNKLSININAKNYANLKEWYISTYKELATIYLKKQNAQDFLSKYVQKYQKSYLPKENLIKLFVEYYYLLYQKIGRIIYG